MFFYSFWCFGKKVAGSGGALCNHSTVMVYCSAQKTLLCSRPAAAAQTNTVSFGVEGLVRLQGELCMRASFTPVSDTQVKITLLDARMVGLVN